MIRYFIPNIEIYFLNIDISEHIIITKSYHHKLNIILGKPLIPIFFSSLFFFGGGRRDKKVWEIFSFILRLQESIK